MHHVRAAAIVLVCPLLLVCACASRVASTSSARPVLEPGLARQVEVIRTDYGVPHIYADNLRALGYALGYLQVEDYGARVPLGLVRARGEVAQVEGRQALDADFDQRPAYLRAVDTYHEIDRDTRELYEGFAAGVNQYIQRHPDEFPTWLGPGFTGYDVAALYIYRPSRPLVRDWTTRLTDRAAAPSLELSEPDRRHGAAPDEPPLPETVFPIEAGSSAWALAPARSASNAAILLRNPHLSWTAGYWEAHVVVPGRLDFYGDFRIGGPLGIVGGFNRHLGFATTNNRVNSAEVYALEADPARPDHYLFDGASRPVGRTPLTLSYRNGGGFEQETRDVQTTHLGPVVHRDASTFFVLRAAEDGEFRAGDQFLRLMQATSLREWTDAMRLQAHPVSNFIYADREGNIFYIWNAVIPVRPHPAGGTMPVAATRTEHVWTRIHDLDSLPQLLNPAGGYLRNENDGPWLANLRARLDPADYPPYFEGQDFALRSQHATRLLDGDRRLSLEDVVRLKHSYRMLLADRVKRDLIAAVRAALDEGTLGGISAEDARSTAAAIALLEAWDNTAAATSRGAVLFAEWWRLYAGPGMAADDPSLFAEPWDAGAPLETPRGLADPVRAARLFPTAVRETATRFGSWDVAWGDVHRIRRGSVDEAVGGCAGALGCIRVLNFTGDADGRRSASAGDGWILAVEFTDPPRAYSVLAYGQSAKEGSPHFDDQAALFARGEMKQVAYTRQDVERGARRRYRPGLE